MSRHRSLLRGAGSASLKKTVPLIAAIVFLARFSSASARGKEVTVAADGSGDFKTVQEAMAAVPQNSPNPTVIHIKPGVYYGQKILPVGKNRVTLKGDDARTTILTWNVNTNETQPPGTDLRHKGTGVAILSDDFRADRITFQNSSGDHGQALALKIDGDRAVVTRCRIVGWQDTLMLNHGRQYFKNCTIEGRVDFIYGSGTALFDNCEIKSKNGSYITAASTPQEKPYGFIFRHCRLTADPNPWIDAAAGQSSGSRPPVGRRAAIAYLGRPWRPYASVAFINCQMADHIRPEGWNNWGNPENEKTARYAEYHSRGLDITLSDGRVITGKPIDVSRRVRWSKQLTGPEAAQYTIARIFGDWNPLSGFSSLPRMPGIRPLLSLRAPVQEMALTNRAGRASSKVGRGREIPAAG